MLLEVVDLAIDLPTPRGPRRVVREVSFSASAGESLGIVGESGSGKTMTALALMGLLPDGAVVSGELRFEGRNLAELGEAEMQKLRGDRIAMIFQEPMSALNPLHRIGAQVAEPLTLHRGLSKAAAWREAVRLLDRVQLRDPAGIARAYPFALSGGERQRAMIAMALSCRPRLIIADEPTTALDVTVQAKILDLLASLSAEDDMAMLLVSHDLAVIARHCRRVLVMYGGAVMEEGPVEAVLGEARHPYTRALAGGAAAPGRAARRTPARDRGRRAFRVGGAERLPVRGPLPVHDRRLPPRAAAAGERRGRTISSDASGSTNWGA